MGFFLYLCNRLDLRVFSKSDYLLFDGYYKMVVVRRFFGGEGMKKGKFACSEVLVLGVLLAFVGCTTTSEEVELDYDTAEHAYVHGEDGYFCLLSKVPYELEYQMGETCWLYSSVASMVTRYEYRTGNAIDLDPMKVLDAVFPDEAEEGLFVQHNRAKKDIGGWTWLVTESLSNGFEGYVLDDATILGSFDADVVKEYLQKQGAVNVVVPDKDQSKQRSVDHYRTLNDVTDKDEDYDHQVVLVGWDDFFPKDYFREIATQDGAWIAHNSAEADQLYYISYDTKLREPIGLSMTDEYSAVLSYDCGNEGDTNIRLGAETKVANVFAEEGKLGAVGLYNVATSQDVCIEIYNEDFTKQLYTQTSHMDTKGYHVIPLEKPVKVSDFAIAVTFPEGAPVEGDTIDMDSILYRPVSHSGESYIYLDGQWQDLSEDDIQSKLGLEVVSNNVCIKGLMK